jgi:hypothetical protein
MRFRLCVAAASIAAVATGVQIADESIFWPSFLAAILMGIAVTQVQPLKIGTLLIGLVVFGYIVGNRGFAQVSLAGAIPLLPAEFVLAVAGSILLYKSLVQRTSFVTKDLLNITLLVWAVLSSLRFPYDLRNFGVFALRDFATVYYAAFFFIAQDAGDTEAGRSFIRFMLLAAMGVLLVISPLYDRFPDFFMDHLTIRQTPLIYLKGDLVGTFAAAGTLIFFARYEQKRSRFALALCIGLAALASNSNNRSSMVGLIGVSVILLLCGRWRYVAIIAGATAAALVVILAIAYARSEPWEETPVYDAYERIVSIGDPLGQGNYSGKDTFYKGDNNAFRLVWWKLTYENTMHTNPLLGLGWGYDLADDFERTYYPEGSEEFSARSPHSVYMTIFGRTGFLGLIPFTVLSYVIVLRTVKALRAAKSSAYLWAAALVILSSAAFGVVLEGPMGAVVFWSILGLASSYDINDDEKEHPLSAPVELK